MNSSEASKTRYRSRNAFVKTLLLIVLLIGATVTSTVWFFRDSDRTAADLQSLITFQVFRGEFTATVVESGDVESSSNVEIRCEVKSKGGAGTTILEIVPEGTEVKKGEFIAQLDDSMLKDELLQQKIVVAQDRAAVIQSQSDLDTGRRMLNEYLNGTYEQEKATLQAEIATAEEAVRRAAEFRRHSENLTRKGYRTTTQLEADVFAEQKAELDLKLAKQSLQVYEDFTRERMIAEFGAEIKKQEANVEAAQFTFQLSTARQNEFEREIANCHLAAPVDGIVVYANEVDRRGDASFVIEEGALLRDGQPIVVLPDPEKMQIRTTVNDSKINRIEVGDPCLIRVDTDPENPVSGKVRRVSSFPLPRRWYQAPIEYEVFVDVAEISPLIRPGLRAKVEIFTERIDDVLQAPLSSIVRFEDDYFVFVRSVSSVAPRKVEIGTNNEKFVVITAGLEAGEEVLVDGDRHKADFKIPAKP